MSNWIAGWNQPGCLPDTTEPPAEFSDWLTAQQWLMTELESDPDYTASVQAAWYALSRAEPDQPFCHRTNDPLLVWWIEPAPPEASDKPPALSQAEMTVLTEAALDIADAVSGEDGEDVKAYWPNIYDPMRSSNGEEYVMSPKSAGWYAKIGEGVYIKVEITMCTDPEIIREFEEQ